MTRRPRLSELLLRIVVSDEESYQGLLGDLHEENERRGEPAGRLAYDRAVLALARSFLAERLPRRGVARTAATSQERAAWLPAALADARAAARLLRRRPGYTIGVVGTLGLGFGAAAAVSSVAYGVWLKPLPFGEPQAIVRVYEVKLDGDEGSLAGDSLIPTSALDADVGRRSWLSPPLLHDMRGRRFSTLTQLASVSRVDVDWRHDGESTRLHLVSGSRGVFDVLQLRPLVGRFFSTGPGVREVVLSEGFWRRSFGADAGVVGRESLSLDGAPHLIVGVVADGLPYPESGGEAWVPADPSDDELTEGMRGARYLDVVGRLRPGATLPEARGELDAFVRGLSEDHPNHEGWGATAVSLRQDLIRPFVGILWVLIVGAALFLAIACSNVAGLVAARRTRDRRERRLRLALGASRGRLLRQEIAEMLWLSAGGAIVAGVLAAWALAPLQRLAPSDLPRIANIRLDPAVVAVLSGFLLLAAIAAAIAGNLLAVRARRPGRETAGMVAPNTGGRATLTIVQVALTTLLLIGGAALAGHFRELARIQPGFVPGPVMTAPLGISANRYAEGAARLSFFESVIEEFEHRGHIAAVGTNPPVAGATMRYGYRPGDGDEDQYWGQYHAVSPRYFEVLGIPLVGGRGFDERDRADGLPVVIISEALASAHFDSDPVGREMIVVGTPREIVGVVGSVHHFGPDLAPPAELYVPLAQDPWAFGHLLVRPGSGFSPDDARRIVAAIDPAVPVEAMFPYARFVRIWFAPLRFQLTVVGLLAAAGTALAVIGLYALIAYVVAGRTREIGIRVALGETTGSVFARVVRRGLTLAAAGLIVGVAAAYALGGLLQSLGMGFDADGPTVLLTVAALVVIAATSACVVPARRAAAVDPVVAMRQE